MVVSLRQWHLVYSLRRVNWWAVEERHLVDNLRRETCWTVWRETPGGQLKETGKTLGSTI